MGIKNNTRAVVGGYSLLLREHTPNDTGIKNNTRTMAGLGLVVDGAKRI